MAKGLSSTETVGGIPHLFQVSSKDFNKNELLEKEVFGPSTLAVTSENKEDVISIAEKIGGNLTATLYATEEDLEEYRELVSVLERKAGRLIINGFPTGVEVCYSMIHGGPFPATTDSRSTSVGTTAIYRFTRPVSYQNFPDHLLPDELKKENPMKIMRLVNGNFER
jgi:NADP-dependent aldehyde dehydrogenase